MSADVAMWRALQHRDIPRLRRALEKGADPCRTDAAGRSALHLAADCDDPRLVKTVLRGIEPGRRRAAVNVADVWGESPLHRAVVSDRRIAQARMLLAAGADAQAPGALGRSPLLMAATMQASRTASLLRRHGGSEALGDAGEAGRRALLGELFGLPGHTQIGGARLPLRHGMAEAAFPWLAQLLERVARDPGPPLVAAAVAHMARAFRQAGLNIGRPPEQLLQAVQTGDTVILPSGTPRHAVIYVWHRGILVACERSRSLWMPWAKRRCRVIRTESPTLAVDDVRALQRGGVLQDPGAQARFRGLATSPRQPIHRCWQRICGSHAFKPQHVNNCVTAGAKMAMYALLALLLPHAGAQQRERWYKQLTTRLREIALADYVAAAAGSGEPPEAKLVRACAARLDKRRAPGSLRRKGRPPAGSAEPSTRAVGRAAASCGDSAASGPLRSLGRIG